MYRAKPLIWLFILTKTQKGTAITLNYISKNQDQKYPLQITDKDICIGINF